MTSRSGWRSSRLRSGCRAAQRVPGGNVSLGNAIGTGRRRRQGDLRLRPRVSGSICRKSRFCRTSDLPDADRRSAVAPRAPGELASKAVGEIRRLWDVIGPHSTAMEREAFRTRSSPSAQTSSPSRRWRFHARRALPRSHRAAAHRPASVVLYGDRVSIVPGGLTRVALRKVRSSSIRRRVAAARTPGSYRT